MSFKTDIMDFTEGRIAPKILAFYFPMFITNLLQQVYTFVDTLIVGQGLGDHALAAVGNINPLAFLIIGFSMGLANGFCISIAKSFGAKDAEKLRKVLAGAIELVLIICAGMTLLSIIGLKPILIIMRTDSVILEESYRYGIILMGGMSTGIYYNFTAGILRSLGDSKTPLKAIIVSAILNMILDYVLIFYCGGGVESAAWATVFAQLVSGTLCLWKISKIEILHLNKDSFHGCSRYWMNLLLNGVPMAIMNSITAVGCMVIQTFVNAYGVMYTSAYTACGRFVNLFMNPAMSAGAAMSSFTGQNDGAGRYDRIREGLKVCLGIATVFYVILGSLMVFSPQGLAMMMLSEEESITLTCSYLPISGVLLFSVNYLFVYRSAVQGLGKPLIPMLSGIAEMVLRVGVIILLMKPLGYPAAAWAEASAWFVAFVMNLVAYYVEIKKKERVFA